MATLIPYVWCDAIDVFIPDGFVVPITKQNCLQLQFQFTAMLFFCSKIYFTWMKNSSWNSTDPDLTVEWNHLVNWIKRMLSIIHSIKLNKYTKRFVVIFIEKKTRETYRNHQKQNTIESKNNCGHFHTIKLKIECVARYMIIIFAWQTKHAMIIAIKKNQQQQQNTILVCVYLWSWIRITSFCVWNCRCDFVNENDIQLDRDI